MRINLPLLALTIATALFSPICAAATTWEEAIAAVDRKSEEIWQLAHTRGLHGKHLGTVYNELHVPEHRCSILGRMLGMAGLVKEIERSAEIDTTDSGAHETGLAAHSLSNWSFSARSILEMDEAHRIREWNLNCVGHLGIPDWAAREELGPPTFYEVKGETLSIFGAVEPGFSAKLRAAITANPHIKYVALGSSGGSVYEAIEAGYFIRQRGLKTSLWRNCYSACTLVFIGGVERLIWSPYPILGFHQISRNGVAVPFHDPAYRDVERYAQDMGVDARMFMETTRSSMPAYYTTTTHTNLCKARIVTWIQRSCWAK